MAALVAMCALGVIGRFLPHMRARLVALVPPALPRPALVVWLSALCEAADVVGLLVRGAEQIVFIGLCVWTLVAS